MVAAAGTFVRTAEHVSSIASGVEVGDNSNTQQSAPVRKRSLLRAPGVAAVNKTKESSSNYLLHTRAVHFQHNKSLLSRSKSKWQSFPDSASAAENTELTFKGFKHLVLMMLFIGNMRIFVADMRQFGILNALKQMGLVPRDFKMGLLIMASNYLYFPVALFIELCTAHFARKWKDRRKNEIARPSDSEQTHLANMRPGKEWWSAIAFIHIINATICITLSSYLTYRYVWHPLAGTLVIMNTIVTFLKLSSYALTNRDLRDSYIADLPVPALYSEKPYPTNLTADNLAYFWFAPTLVYQPVYPRTPHIRWSVSLSLLVELTIGMTFIWLLAIQFTAPILEHMLVHYQAGKTTKVFDDFLGLVGVNMITWLLGFFVIFQSMLNLLAELTRFADREFYGPWWNAGSVGTYWRDWNKPVSNYLRRHVYVPLRKRGWRTSVASAFVFFLSAVLHELMVGVPTKNFNGVAFFCMMAQVPLIQVTNPLEKMRGPGTTIGNCIFWLSIFLGLPTGTVIYYLSWNLRYNPIGQ